MKRTVIKLTILIAIIFAIVTCIVIWKEAKLTPPNNLELKNEHFDDIQNCIAEVSLLSMENDYQECVYKLRRYDKEGLVDSKSMKQFQMDFMDKYTPIFISESNKCFRQSKWDVEPWTHEFMKKRVTELKERDSQFNEKEYTSQLNDIINIIDRYDKAYELSTWTRYKNLKTTSGRERMAREYKNDTILRNCRDLVKKLDELPGKIKNNHLKYIETTTEELVCDDMYHFEEYNKKVKSLYNNEIVDGYDKHYNNVEDTKMAKKKLLDRELEYLNSYVNYIIDTNNFSKFENYAQYESANSHIDRCINELSLNKDVRYQRTNELSNKLSKYTVDEYEFKGYINRHILRTLNYKLR